MKYEGLSPGQRRVLSAICEMIRTRGIPPTLRELMALLGIGSTNGVSDHLLGLVRKGYITREASTARGIVLTGKGRDFAQQSLEEVR